MELLSVIRRWYHREHLRLREIERRTGLSRSTIRKYLRSDTVEVRFKVPERPSRLDPFADRLSEWLRLEASKGRKTRRPGGDREMVDVLALVLQHDEEAVLCAVELGFEGGIATKTHVLDILHRLTHTRTRAADIDTPQALVLKQEPRADIERYDALRDREVRHAS